MERIRAFIAIELPGDVKQALTRLQYRLKSGCKAPVRWADPEDTHLTLKFLGDINSGITGQVTVAMEEAARGIRPFHLAVNCLGVFLDPRRVRVVWVGLTGDMENLDKLHKRLEAGLKPLGFTTEARPFTPHLTLGRVREQAGQDERQVLGQLVADAAGDTASALEVNAVHLIKSRLTPQGPVYTRLSSVELK